MRGYAADHPSQTVALLAESNILDSPGGDREPVRQAIVAQSLRLAEQQERDCLELDRLFGGPVRLVLEEARYQGLLNDSEVHTLGWMAQHGGFLSDAANRLEAVVLRS
jgi:hypothetical protein